jgi:hypothetical protein
VAAGAVCGSGGFSDGRQSLGTTWSAAPLAGDVECGVGQCGEPT